MDEIMKKTVIWFLMLVIYKIAYIEQKYIVQRIVLIYMVVLIVSYVMNVVIYITVLIVYMV